MGRKRTTHHGLPERWAFQHGAYYYRVPPGDSSQWDGKKLFRLGTVYSEALEVFAGRIAQGTITTFDQLIDSYIISILPLKAISTQTEDRRTLDILRRFLGAQDVAKFRPSDGPRLEKLLFARIDENNKRRERKFNGYRSVKKQMSMARDLFAFAKTETLIEGNPLADFQMDKRRRAARNKSKAPAFIPSFAHIEKCLPYAPEWLGLYIRLKVLTGVRQTDILRMDETVNIRQEGLFVDGHKVLGHRSVKAQIFTWTNELLLVVSAIQKLWPHSPLFFPRHGFNAKGKPEGFNDAWGRFRKKLEGAGLEPFAERYIRNRVGSEGSVAEAQERLGHADSATTEKFYRVDPVVVQPLGSNGKSKNIIQPPKI